VAEAGEEGKDGKRIEEDTYRNIDTNLSSLDVLCEFTRCTATLREDGDTVTVFIRIDDIDGFIERLGVEADKDGPEDLFLVAGHVFCHVGDDCRTDLLEVCVSISCWQSEVRNSRQTHKIPIRILLRSETPPIQQNLRALFLSTLNQTLNPLPTLRADNRPNIRSLLKAAIHFQALGPLRQLRQPLLRLPNHNQRTQRHAPLARRAERRARYRIQCLVLIRVREYRGVVLGAEIRLDALPVGGSALVDVLAGFVGADEGDCLDFGGIKDVVHGSCTSVDNVDYAGREASLCGEFGEDHHSAGVALGGLDDDGIARYGSNRNGPEGNHGGEVWEAVC